MKKVKILGRPWKVSVLEGDKFLRRFKEEAAGFTLPDSMEIVIHEDEFNLKTIRHELLHAYYDGLCVSSADLTHHQIEEIFCELIAEHGESILKQAKHLYKDLKDAA